MRIIFCGTPHFAVPSLKKLLDSGAELVLVVTQPDRLKGRGHRLSQSPVKDFAVSRNITVMQPAGIRTADFPERLLSLSPDVIVVVAYGKIIPPSVLGIPALGCVNVHASLLPKYRGAAPIQRAIMRGESVTGVTTMLMNEGLDTGDMLLQEETGIGEDENAESLSQRLSEIGAGLLVRTLEGLKDGSVSPVPQAGTPSYAPPLTKDDGRINWSLGARQISDLIRGTFPWPGGFCFLKGEKISIVKARPIHLDSPGIPGRIEKISDEGLYISAGKGILSVLEVRPEGKKTMPAAAFAHGRHLREGMYFDA